MTERTVELTELVYDWNEKDRRGPLLRRRPGFVDATIREGLQSARAIRADVRELLARAGPDGCVRRAFVHFPDPWWKKRHAKRRLFRPEFSRSLCRTLRSGGSVYVISDVERRFEEISASLEEADLTRREWRRADDAPGQSSYERKYRRQGRAFFSARFERQA